MTPVSVVRVSEQHNVSIFTVEVCHISEYSNLHSNGRNNLKSHSKITKSYDVKNSEENSHSALAGISNREPPITAMPTHSVVCTI